MLTGGTGEAQITGRVHTGGHSLSLWLATAGAALVAAPALLTRL
ncbi:hypothetical protein ACIBHX_06220 [Nonomuraea sp. NPDC050536]